jgi:hypothetical protein
MSEALTVRGAPITSAHELRFYSFAMRGDLSGNAGFCS